MFKSALIGEISIHFNPKCSYPIWDDCISAVAGSLKASVSRMVRKEFADEIKKFYSKPVFWAGSYYVASSGGAPIERLKEYIKSQDVPVT